MTNSTTGPFGFDMNRPVQFPPRTARPADPAPTTFATINWSGPPRTKA